MQIADRRAFLQAPAKPRMTRHFYHAVGKNYIDSFDQSGGNFSGTDDCQQRAFGATLTTGHRGRERAGLPNPL